MRFVDNRVRGDIKRNAVMASLYTLSNVGTDCYLGSKFPEGGKVTFISLKEVIPKATLNWFSSLSLEGRISFIKEYVPIEIWGGFYIHLGILAHIDYVVGYSRSLSSVGWYLNKDTSEYSLTPFLYSDSMIGKEGKGILCDSLESQANYFKGISVKFDVAGFEFDTEKAFSKDENQFTKALYICNQLRNNPQYKGNFHIR